MSGAVTATAPIIVERAMYRSTERQGVHRRARVSLVSRTPALHWYFAEGATGPFFDMFILLANPSALPASVKIEYLLSTGEVLAKTYSVPANGRKTVYVDDEEVPGVSGRPLANVAVSSAVTSLNQVPIVVERTMWWPGAAISAAFWTEAHNSVGVTTTGRVWAMADGEVGGESQAATYVLVANTSSYAGQGRVSVC